MPIIRSSITAVAVLVVLCGINEERNILHDVKGRKGQLFGHILHRNCLLKHVIEGRIGSNGKTRKKT
jgi:hypothetical protein